MFSFQNEKAPTQYFLAEDRGFNFICDGTNRKDRPIIFRWRVRLFHPHKRQSPGGARASTYL